MIKNRLHKGTEGQDRDIEGTRLLTIRGTEGTCVYRHVPYVPFVLI